MNVLVDTNVVLSAALRDRLPERVVQFIAMHDDWKWLVTPEIIAEYVEVLERPKFRLSHLTLADWAALIELRTVMVASPPAAPNFPRDPKDVPFLAAALATKAEFLITGDKDLLEAKAVIPARILTVAEFAREFQIS